MADSPLEDSTNAAQRQPKTAAPRAGPQKTCPGCDARVPNSKKECDGCGHVFVSKKQRDAAAAPPPPPRPDRKKIKVESTEERESNERVDAWRAPQSKVQGLSTATRARDRTISKTDIDVTLGLLGAPKKLFNPSKGHSDEDVFTILTNLAEEHDVSLEPRASLSILDHGRDVVTKLVVKLSKLEDAELAEKLDAVKDRVKESQRTMLQTTSCFVTNPKLGEKGRAVNNVKRVDLVRRRGLWGGVWRRRAEARHDELGFEEDSDVEECDPTCIKR